MEAIRDDPKLNLIESPNPIPLADAQTYKGDVQRQQTSKGHSLRLLELLVQKTVPSC